MSSWVFILTVALLAAGGALALRDSPRIVGESAYEPRLSNSGAAPAAVEPASFSVADVSAAFQGADVQGAFPGTDAANGVPGVEGAPAGQPVDAPITWGFSRLQKFFNVLRLPLVKTPSGWVRGSLLQSRKHRVIYSFRGIRYVKAPVGELRFKPPQEYPAWSGVFDASKDGAACPQENHYDFPTNEDCLFLNVYTTKLPSLLRNPKRPVFLYIHMGGWYGNNARSDNHGPQYLADQDIVIVTFNYRLGALGFLSTGDGVIPGNNAMKDQVAAMRWVQKHIHAFGGDPNRVTLAGYSAGAAAVWFHLASPMSKGLFHQAIAMSSSINPQDDLTQDIRGPLALARRQAIMAGCDPNHVETSHEIKDCLMALPAQNISGTLAAGELFDWGIDPILIWYPVIEKDTPENPAFLSKNALDYFSSGNFNTVPFITGHTRDEFDWRASTVFYSPKLLNDMNSNWTSVAPRAFMYVNSPNSDKISQDIKDFYLGGGPVTEKNVKNLSKCYSDAIIQVGVDRSVRAVSKLNPNPVWYYEFEYQGRYSYQYRRNTTIPYGVMHQDDVMYFFYLSAIFPYFEPDAPEIFAVERLTKLWGNFVIHGHPTPQGEKDPLLGVDWKPYLYNSNKKEYLLFSNSSLQMAPDVFQERVAFWEKLFPIDHPYEF